MSHSYKHTPGFFDRNPFAKQQANRKVRRTLEVPNGKAYRRLFESYDICDYVIYLRDMKDWLGLKAYRARMK